MASTLAYREFGLSWHGAPHCLLALGDRAHAANDWASALAADFAIRLLDAPRRADPRRFGVPTQAGDWYVETEEGPDPHAFHLSLVALESSLLEIRPGAGILFGVGQGASLSLALACCWSDRLAAVVACQGTLPTLPPDGLEERPLAGLPVLCVGAASGAADELTTRGGRVTTSAAGDAAGIATWLLESTRTRAVPPAQGTCVRRSNERGDRER